MKRPLSVLCLFVIIGVFFLHGFKPPAYASYGEYVGEEVTLGGRVYAKEFKKGEKDPVLYLFIKPYGLFYENREIPYEDNFIAVLENADDAVHIGSAVLVHGILTPYEAPANKGQFDERQYYRLKGVSARIKRAEMLFCDGKKTFLRKR